MKRLFSISLLILLTACTIPTVQQSLPAGQPIPASCTYGTGQDANANATAASRCQQDTAATVIAINQGTAVALQAAENERVAATAQAAAVASETAVAATITSESIEVRITELALAFQMGDATATAGHQQTRNAEESTRVAAVATAEAESLRLQQLATKKMLEQQEKTAAFWNAAKYVMLAVLVILVVGLAIYIGMWVWTNRKPVQVVKDKNGRVMQIFVMAPDGGFRALARNQTLLQQPEVAGLIEAPSGPITPSWDAFMQHRDRFSVPVGIDATSREPIFIDRRRNPHILFAGASGAGKSASGIIPFALAMWGANAHVVIVNGKGADYNAINGEQNFTMFARPDVADLIRPLSALLDALEKEYQRREQVLARYNANDWNALPPHAGEYGEIVIVLEEFLALIEKAEEVAKMARMNRDTAVAQDMEMVVSQLWFRLSSLVSQARKTGIFLVVALTDVTNDAIGKQAAKLKRQMARVVYRMNSAPSSRSLLDVERGSDYANGTVGFPTGQFLINTEGQVRHGVAFYPQDSDIDSFLVSRQVRPAPLPDLVLNAIQTESGVWTVVQPAIAAPGPQVQIGRPVARMQLNGPVTQAQQDAKKLDGRIEECKSIRDAGRVIYDLDDPAASVSGDMMDTRVIPALKFRAVRGCEHSTRLLARSSKHQLN